MNFDLLSFVLGTAVGIGISYLVVWWLGRMIYRKLEAAVAAAVDEQQTETKSKRIDIKVEQHGDVLYAFRSDNDGFVCQGGNLAELRKHFLQKFPGQVGSVIGATDELHRELVKQSKEIKNESSTGIGSAS